MDLHCVARRDSFSEVAETRIHPDSHGEVGKLGET